MQLVIERRHGRTVLLVWRNCRRRSNRQLLQKTLAQWQSMLPNTWINIDKLIFLWQEWQGKLSLALTSDIQRWYQGES